MNRIVKPLRSNLVETWKAMRIFEAAQIPGSSGEGVVAAPPALEQYDEKSMAGLFVASAEGGEVPESTGKTTIDRSLEILLGPEPSFESQESLEASGIMGMRRSAYIALSACLLDYLSRPQGLKLEDAVGHRFKTDQFIQMAWPESGEQQGQLILPAQTVVTVEDIVQDRPLYGTLKAVQLRVESVPPSPESDEMQILEDASYVVTLVSLALPRTPDALARLGVHLSMASPAFAMGEEGVVCPAKGDVIVVRDEDFQSSIGERID